MFRISKLLDDITKCNLIKSIKSSQELKKRQVKYSIAH